MKHEFVNDSPVEIERLKPTDVSSSIQVSNVDRPVTRVNATITIAHTYTADLKITLVAPNGRRVLLAGHEGGSGNHFINTTFDDGAATSVVDARAPFTGSFQPEGNLAHLRGYRRMASGFSELKIAMPPMEECWSAGRYPSSRRMKSSHNSRSI